MDVFRVRDRLIDDYREFTGSFVDIHDKNIRSTLLSGWPGDTSGRTPGCRSTRTSPPAGRSPSWSTEGLLHPECERIFRLKDDSPTARCSGCTGTSGRRSRRRAPGSSYVLTTGTGSGKSLAYIVPIVDRVLAAKAAGTYRPGIKAIVVYPMNALANSQLGELEKFLRRLSRGPQPVTLRPLHRAGVAGRARAGSSPTRRTSC